MAIDVARPEVEQDRQPARDSPLMSRSSPRAAGAAVRVLYVLNTADLYGASRALVRLVRTADRNRVEPIVFIPADGPIKEILEGYGIEVVIDPLICVVDRLNFRPLGLLSLAVRFPLSVIRLATVILRRRIKLVHTNTAVIVSPAMAALLTGVPHIWHVREMFQEFGAIWPLFARYILGTSRWVIAISRSVAEQFPPSRKVVVINDVFDLEEFDVDRARLRAEFREQHGLGDGPVVGCVGRIKFVRKGQEFLVQAAAILKGRGIRAKYLIVGSAAAGNEHHLERLRRLIRELDVEDDVVFAGELADVRPAYAAMDMFILPSAQPEPFGLVVLEAMGMGLPVVATRFGGPVETVEDGRTGFLVAPSDPEALAEKIALLLADPARRRSFGEAGRERVASHFSVQSMWRGVDAVYRESSSR